MQKGRQSPRDLLKSCQISPWSCSQFNGCSLLPTALMRTSWTIVWAHYSIAVPRSPNLQCLTVCGTSSYVYFLPRFQTPDFSSKFPEFQVLKFPMPHRLWEIKNLRYIPSQILRIQVPRLARMARRGAGLRWHWKLRLGPHPAQLVQKFELSKERVGDVVKGLCYENS